MLLENESAVLPPINWRAARQQTQEIIRKHSRTFFWATALLPRREREAIRSLYAFCRKTDDLVDRRNVTRAELDAWREQVEAPTQAQTDPVLQVWSQTREEFGVDRKYERELIDGVAMDLECRSYPTWEELQNYCYHVASTVGLLSMPIVGTHKGVHFDQAAPFAIKLGIALQLTNILRDVGEDLERGRIYLPDEDLERFDLNSDDIREKVYDERFRNLIQFEIDRARELYRQALPGIALLSKAARPAVGAAALLYQAILDEIELINHQVYTIRAYTSGWRKLQMLPGIVWKVAHLQPPDLAKPVAPA